MSTSSTPAPDQPKPAGKPKAPSHHVALIGNPNTGKSTLFNRLSGMNAHVGNYPGVTVEKKVGRYRNAGETIHVVDLPGTYSLSPRTADEMVSVQVLLGEQKDLPPIDAVLCIVDSLQLQRNFYLVSQILDMQRPTILVLNMADEVERQNMKIDAAALEKRLGVPVVPIAARSGQGIDELKTRLHDLLAKPTEEEQTPDSYPSKKFPDAFLTACQELQQAVEEKTGNALPDYLAERLLLDVHGETERVVLKGHPELGETLTQMRQTLTQNGCPIPAIEPRVRYSWAREVLQDVITQPTEENKPHQDGVDRWLTHRWTGPLIFAGVMLLMFQAIYSWAGPLMDLIESLQGNAADAVIAGLPPGALRSLIVDGLIGGVGSVVVFLPQIAILFLFIALLEDCGYMARAAYIMDRVMSKFGLSGKSFVPLMSSYACAIPGIMATRTIEDRKDRMVTILIAPLMSCSARLPVYLLMINAFVPKQTIPGTWIPLQGTVLFAFYLLGALVAIPIAWFLKSTWFRGEPAPFVLELPRLKWPSAKVAFDRVWDRSKAFVVNAGTLIFATTVLVWAAGYFPSDRTALHQIDAQIEQSAEQVDESALEGLQKTRKMLASDAINSSFLGMAGHTIEPVVKPLGWDWRIGMSVIASFPAREVVIGTLGTIFSLGGEVNEEDADLIDRMHSATHADGSPLFNIPVALSVMVFFALCAQCGATLMVIKRETNSWIWPVVSFSYMTGLAYIGALITYQVGMILLG